MLTPIPSADVDARLRPHLDPEERVLWQDRPKPGSFFGPVVIAGGLGLVLFGLFLLLGVAGNMLTPQMQYGGAAAAAFAGLVILAQGLRRRAARWSYAVTDRRLISVLGKRLIRSVTPEQLDRLTLTVRGNTVYWFRIHHNQSRSYDRGNAAGPDGRFIGFHGLADAEAVKAMIEAWRLAMSRRAAETASSFAQSRATPRPDEGTVADGTRRIRHPQAGLSMDMPSDWQALVSTRTDAPLQIFGITLLPRFIRESEKRPYAPDLDWNILQVKAAPEAGLVLTLADGPMTQTLEGVLSDRWSAITGATILTQEPDYRAGPFRGFGVTRRLPKGAQVRSTAALSAPAMLRQLWLEGEGLCLELEAYALEGQTEIWRGIEAMIASLDLRG